MRILRGAGLLVSLLACSVSWAQAPQIGNKLLGTLGLEAGAQVDPGFFVVERALYLSSNQLRDRFGETLPVGLDLQAFGNAVGVAATFKLPLGIHWNLAVAAPAARVWGSIEEPRASVDRSGLGDVYVQPAKLGWQLQHGDIVAGYSFYAPTGHFEPRSGTGIGRGNWTHEFSGGGSLYWGEERSWNLSALASYDWNLRKRGIDITRGETIQVQGGLGKTFLKVLSVGPTGYALWQVRDDRGADLPPVLRGARDRVYGAGVEVGLLVPSIRSRLSLRYSHDIAVRTRPLAQSVVFGLSFVGWRPKPAS